MKFGNLLGAFINVLLIVAGLLLIVAPVKYWFMALESNPYFTDEQHESLKSAVEPLFYKGDYGIFPYITPVLDNEHVEKADLPAGITPELAGKFIMAQAVVNTSLIDARFVTNWAPLIVGGFCALGAIAVLLGMSLYVTQRKLDKILESKNN